MKLVSVFITRAHNLYYRASRSNEARRRQHGGMCSRNRFCSLPAHAPPGLREHIVFSKGTHSIMIASMKSTHSEKTFYYENTFNNSFFLSLSLSLTHTHTHTQAGNDPDLGRTAEAMKRLGEGLGMCVCVCVFVLGVGRTT